jgi:hypothetical protein
MPSVFPTTLAENNVAQALSFGKLFVTVKSLKSGQHLTLKFVAKVKKETGGYGKVESLSEATHVFVSDAHDWTNKVGTFYPRNGKFYDADGANQGLVFAAEQVLQYATWGEHHPRIEIVERQSCRRCGAALDDNVSKDRGFGPDCFGIITGSKHVSRKARGARVTASGTAVADAANRSLLHPEDAEAENYYARRDAARSDDR